MTSMHAGPLPRLDEHTATIAASVDGVWEGLLEIVAEAGSSTSAAIVMKILDCDERTASGPRPLGKGSTTPGFRVAVADPGRELILTGRHHFASYALAFHIHRRGVCETQLRAVSWANFSGPFGCSYGRLLISSGLHARAVQSLLAAVRRRAERSTRQTA